MTTETVDRAREQARAQLESVVEMVAGLDREQAAGLYVKELTRERIIELLADIDADTDEDERAEAFDSRKDEDTDELRTELADEIAAERVEPDDFEFDAEEARERITEDALSVEVRTGWYTPGEEKPEAEEYMILLCTGGPAVRIVGDLDRGEPDRARIEYQDWGTPWTELVDITSEEREALLTYARCFYFGE